jgi:hypothetical protein
MVLPEPILKSSLSEKEDNEVRFKVNDYQMRFTMFADQGASKFYIKQ